MEQTLNNNTKKHFSTLGLILFLGTLLIFGVQILSLFLAEQIPAVAENKSLSFLATMLPMYIIGFPIIFLMLKKVPAQTGLEKKKMKPLHLFAAFLMAYSATYICNIVGNIITFFIGIFKQSTVENVILEATSGLNPIANIFIIVICAPIMEELLFRKFLVDRTAQYGEGVAIVFSGLIFGLFHGNLVQFSYAFVLGIFFAFIYIKTRNIIYPIILHMIQNFLGSFFGMYIIEKSGCMELLEASTASLSETELMNLIMDNIAGLGLLVIYILLLLCFVFAGIIIFLINRKKFTLNVGEITIEKGQRFKTIILNLGMILYCAFWIIQIILQLLQ